MSLAALLPALTQHAVLCAVLFCCVPCFVWGGSLLQPMIVYKKDFEPTLCAGRCSALCCAELPPTPPNHCCRLRVTGVPYFLIKAADGDSAYTVSGAQDATVFRDIIRRVLSEMPGA